MPRISPHDRTALAARLRTDPAPHLFVQIGADDAPAIHLCRQLGFTTVTTYNERVLTSGWSIIVAVSVRMADGIARHRIDPGGRRFGYH